MTRILAISVLVCGLLCATAAPGAADTITFDNSSAGGLTMGPTVTLNGGVIDAVARTLTTIGFNITGTCGVGGIYGCLSITPGTFEGPDLSTTETNDYLFTGNLSHVSIVGGLVGQDGAQIIPNGTPLFTGSFVPTEHISLTFDDVCFMSGGPECTGSLNGTLAIGTVNPILASALGVDPGGSDGPLFVGVAGDFSMPLSGPAVDANVIGPAVGADVIANPEPGTLILLGSGLLFAARFARRRRSA